MKTIVWITGKMGVGKTTLILNLQKKLDCDTILIGQECRKKFGEKSISEMKNPGAPVELDSFVKSMLCDKIESSVKNIILVDGFPRKPSQVDTVLSGYVFSKTKFDNMFVFVNCDKNERIMRIRDRDKSDAACALADARISKENENMFDLYEYVFARIASIINVFVRVEFVDTTKIEYSEGKESKNHDNLLNILSRRITDLRCDSVSYMLRLNNEFSNITFKGASIGFTMEDLYSESSTKDELPPMSNSVQWARRFVQRAIEELVELLEEMPEAWWSKDMAKIHKARVELIDAWHFLLSAMFAMGMNGKTFASTYFKKREVNMNRQVAGYTKLNKVKGDDDHVGRFEK